jgi:glutathione S-transferase
MKLYVGSKRLSSWSLRAYLALSATPAKFETIVIILDVPGTTEEILKVNPTGRVPVLYDGDLAIWDSLAICEYAHEQFGNLWPADRAQRARARSISAEMHSSFSAMREHMWMDIGAHKPGVGHTPTVLADIARIKTIWNECLAASGGPFLFGTFTIADAMYAPVTTRFVTYGVPMTDRERAYVDAIAQLPAMQAWTRDAVMDTSTPS